MFVGVLRIETERSEDSESIFAELKGSHGLFSAHAKTNFGKLSTDFKASVLVSMYHEGGLSICR